MGEKIKSLSVSNMQSLESQRRKRKKISVEKTTTFKHIMAKRFPNLTIDINLKYLRI